MKTLVCIQACAKEQAIIDLLSPYWATCGCDIVGLEGDDSPVVCWPAFIKGIITAKKTPAKWCGYGLHPSYLLNGLREVDREFSNKYDAVLWTESDSLFLGKVPESVPPGFSAFIAGSCPPEWNCGDGLFLHPPFWMSMFILRHWLRNAAKYVGVGNGTIDVLSALACERGEISQPEGVWSTNGLDMRMASRLQAARHAANTGAWHIHGIKRQDHLDYILGKTDDFPADVIME